MKTKIFFLATYLGIFLGNIQGQTVVNQLPRVDNLKVTVDTLRKEVKIAFDLEDAENQPITISFQASNDNGETYLLNTVNATGDLGNGIGVGKNKKILWNFNNIPLVVNNLNIKIIADDLYKIDINELINQVNIDKLKENLLVIQGNRFPRNLNGQIGLTKARKLIENKFIENKFLIEKQEFSVNEYNTYNLIAKKAGVENEANAFMLNAYYDTKEKVNGADTNGSGVVGMLEASRILSKYNFKKSIIFAGFDLKFQESTGCVKYVFEGGIKETEKIEGAICLDGIGSFKTEPKSQFIPEGFDQLFPEQAKYSEQNQLRGDFILNVSNDNSASLMKEFEKNAKNYVPELKVMSLILPKEGKLTPELAMSDHVAFWYGKIKAININDTGYTRDMAISYEDSIENVNFNFVSNIVKTTIATLANLAEIQHSSVSYAKAHVFLATR
jgi:Peptidase family M28